MSDPRVYNIHNANIYFDWGWEGIGFGELWVGKSADDGHLVVDAETMSKESARKLLHAMVDKLLDEAELR